MWCTVHKYEIDRDSSSTSTLGKEPNPSMWAMQDVFFDDESTKVAMSSLRQIKTSETNYQHTLLFPLWISFCKSFSTKRAKL
jgi:hypothetical protein